MINFYKFSIAAALMSLLFVSCGEDPTDNSVESVFSGYDESLTKQELFADDLSAKEFTFTSTSNWSATTANIENGTESWITVEPAEGAAGESTISITTLKNYTSEQRSARIEIEANYQTISVVLLQSGTAADGSYLIDPSLFFIPVDEDASLEQSCYADQTNAYDAFAFNAPVEWSATSSDSWLRVVNTAVEDAEAASVATGDAGDNQSISFESDINYTEEERTATVTITDATGVVASCTLTFTQSAQMENGEFPTPEFTIEDEALETQTIEATESFTSIKFSAPSTWEAIISYSPTVESGAEWLLASSDSYEAGTMTLNFTTGVNITEADRTATVTISATGDKVVTPLTLTLTQKFDPDGNAQLEFTDIQNATQTIYANELEYQDISFYAPAPWSFDSAEVPTWLNMVIKSGSQEAAGNVTLSLSATSLNVSPDGGSAADDNNAEITLTTSQLGASGDITLNITQKGTLLDGNPFIMKFTDATDNSIGEIDCDSTSPITINFTAPYFWELTSEGDWLSPNKSSGDAGVQSIALTPTVNPSTGGRSITITIQTTATDANGDPAKLEYTITQAGNPDGTKQYTLTEIDADNVPEGTEWTITDADASSESEFAGLRAALATKSDGEITLIFPNQTILPASSLRAMNAIGELYLDVAATLGNYATYECENIKILKAPYLTKITRYQAYESRLTTYPDAEQVLYIATKVELVDIGTHMMGKNVKAIASNITLHTNATNLDENDYKFWTSGYSDGAGSGNQIIFESTVSY